VRNLELAEHRLIFLNPDREHRPRVDVNGDHEAVCPLELKSLASHSVRLNLTRRDNEAIIAGCTLIREGLHSDRMNAVRDS
jgi:hypothetical protein